jgi:Pyruvate/2-oxoacid:ferredoxin oxidoreductase delta subunit
MPTRDIVEIDEQKCDGCGQCVTACAEGAIRIVNGKARLVSDVYCDGLGACLGHCPQGAIRIIKRQAAAFDEEAVRRHTAPREAVAAGHHHGCPGAAVRSLMGGQLPQARPPFPARQAPADGQGLMNWPIQLRLVPPEAPFLKDADVVLAADCAAFAMPGFHQEVLKGRPLLIACPKLDDAQAYVEKLARIFLVAEPRSLTVVRMEVPCCMGLMRIAQAARAMAGSPTPVEEIVVGIEGQRIGR